MQSVNEAWSAVEVAPVRKIVASASVAWKKEFLPSIHVWQIGVSLIGGPDFIGDSGVAPENAWNKYLYNDESDNLLGLNYDRGLNIPLGGISKAIADIRLDNTSGRYTPRYAGGHSELFTAIQPRKPVILNAGFNIDGVDQTIPQFVGVLSKQPKIDSRAKTADLAATDFIGFLQGQYVDKEAMFTSQRTDVVIEDLLVKAGFATSQYDLDPGLNVIRWGIFKQGERFADLIDKLAKSEYGHFYQNAGGKLVFASRYRWTNYPYYNVQRVITTSQVINSVVPAADHIVNVVEVKASPRDLRPSQIIWQATGYSGSGIIALEVGDTEVQANFNDPIFQIDSPVRNGTPGQSSYFIGNTKTDGTGTDVTAFISVKAMINSAQQSKIVFSNSYGSEIFITTLDLWGRAARLSGDIYYRSANGASMTAYEEQSVSIQNDYIQDASWAQSYAELLLRDFANPDNLQEITIRSVPELEVGDLISWRGSNFFIYDIKTQLDPGVGFIQDLKLLQHQNHTYFRCGVSLIGSTDEIGP